MPMLYHVMKALLLSDMTRSPTIMIRGKSSSKAGEGAKTKSAKTKQSSKSGKGMRRNKPIMLPQGVNGTY